MIVAPATDPLRPGDEDARFMRRALALAERGWGRVAPNPLVGAVVVLNGEVVGEGFHSEYGRPHAEVEALRAAGDRARGATLYVTLEPCSHHGKTPPCTDAVRAAGITRVVFAAADPNPRAAGGARVLREAGIAVTGGVEEAAAHDLDAAFFFAHRETGSQRPWIALKLALSLDARIADAEGRSTWITGEPAREQVHRLRAGYDAIAAGIGTVFADDPRLTVRGPVEPRRPPIRIVFDRLLRLLPSSYLARTAGEVPVWAISGPTPPTAACAALRDMGVEVIPAADLEDGLRQLRDRGIRSLFCEGGAAMAAALLSAELVDRLYMFYAPLFLGNGGRAPFAELPDAAVADAVRWRHLRTDHFGADTLITLAR